MAKQACYCLLLEYSKNLNNFSKLLTKNTVFPYQKKMKPTGNSGMGKHTAGLCENIKYLLSE